MVTTRLGYSFALLLSVTACGSDERDETDDVPNPGAELDGSVRSDGSVIVDIDAALRPDSGLSTLDSSLGTLSDASLALPDGAVPSANCADGFPRGASSTERRDVRQTTPTIEGVAVCPNGNVFVNAASASEVWRIPYEGGEPEVWYKHNTGVLAGLDCDAQNRLYAADFGWVGARGSVVAITAKDTGTPYPQPNDTATQGYQGVLAVESKGVYASDPVAGRIVFFHDVNGTAVATVASNDVTGASGLARGTNDRLYVAITNNALFDDEVVSFAIGADGLLTDRKVAWSGPHEINAIAIDENNTIYISFPSEGKVIRASDNATVALATNAASLAFRGSTLLYTEFDRSGSRSEKLAPIYIPVTTGHLWAIDLGVCGAP